MSRQGNKESTRGESTQLRYQRFISHERCAMPPAFEAYEPLGTRY